MSDELNFDPSGMQPESLGRRFAGILLTCATPSRYASLEDYNQFKLFNGAPIVDGFTPDSPARKVGIMKGDLIVEVDGINVSALPGGSKDQLGAVVRYITNPERGSVLMFKVQRGEEELSFKLVLENKNET